MASPKPPSMPSKVRVGGKDITVKLRKPADMLDGALGTFAASSLAIEINRAQHGAERAETLLHEILHAVTSQFSIEIDDATEEKVVNALSTGLFAVIRDNPKVIAYIAGAK